MKLILHLLLLQWLFLPATSFMQPVPSNAEDLAILYSSNVQGETEPCG